MRIALFVTCLNDAFFPQAGIATVTVLERLGHTVAFPAAQSCCGQLHANTGYAGRRPARWSATPRRPSRVTTSWSPRPAPAWRHLRAHAALPVHELSELLVDVLGVTDVGARFPHRVTYHPTCHGLRTLRLGDRPLPAARARCATWSWSTCRSRSSAAASAARSR